MKRLALLAALAGCSSAFQPAAALLEEGGADAREEAEPAEASADAPWSRDATEADAATAPESATDAPADGAHDSSAPEACAPPPLYAAPVGCVAEPPPPAVGQLWVMQTEATPPWCRAFTLAGSENCERCASTFTCACLAPYLADAGGAFQRGTTGQGCLDTSSGPYFSE